MIFPRFLRPSLSPAAFMRLAIALSSVLIAAGLQWAPPSTRYYFAGEWFRDRLIRLHASSAPENRITVVDIDEASLSEGGPWPWPREKLADMAENLLIGYGAKAVAFDLLLPDPGDRDGDARLAMLAGGQPLILAQAFDFVPRPNPLRVGRLAGGKKADGAMPAATPSGYIANHAGLAAARMTGNIGLSPDRDGVIRRLPLLTRFEGHDYPALAVALHACCGDAVRSPSPDDASWPIPFSREEKAYTVIPASDILAMRAPKDLLAGRLVLLGSSSLGLSDRVATPLSPSTSGVMVHAAALTALLDRDAGSAPQAWNGRLMAVGFSLAIALLAAYSFPRLSAALNIGILLAASAAWLAVAYWISPHDLTFSTTAPLASNLFLLIVGVPFDWQLTQRKSRRLLDTLNQYVAKPVVDALLRSDLKDPLTPRRGDVTTLIADMEGYTHQVEALPMEEAAELTTQLLGCLARPVLLMHGTLDKFTGDGLVAFWGAPLPMDEHADLALDAAKEIIREVEVFSRARQAAGFPPLRVRIGIESGTAMAGDFGMSGRSIYTAVGDSVNVASRLEQMAKDLPHDIIIGPGAAAALSRHRVLALKDVVLRGKEKLTTLYTLEEAAADNRSRLG